MELVSEAEVQGRLFALSCELRDVLEVQQRQAVRAEAAAWALPALLSCQAQLCAWLTASGNGEASSALGSSQAGC